MWVQHGWRVEGKREKEGTKGKKVKVKVKVITMGSININDIIPSSGSHFLAGMLKYLDAIV